MKGIVLGLGIFLLCINIAQGQRTCGSEIDMDLLQQTNPARYQRIMALENQIQAYLYSQTTRAIPQTTITIPVVVHVVYNNSTQNISNTQINAQIHVLNQDYRRLNADKTKTPSAFTNVAGDTNI
jgi:hypothetical protein